MTRGPASAEALPARGAARIVFPGGGAAPWTREVGAFELICGRRPVGAESVGGGAASAGYRNHAGTDKCARYQEFYHRDLHTSTTASSYDR